MKSLNEYILEQANPIDKALSFMDDVVDSLTSDTDTWKIISNDDDNDNIVGTMHEKEIFIHQDERKIEYNFKTNDNNSESNSLVQVILYFNSVGRIYGDKFAINIELLGNNTITEYLDSNRYLGKRLKDDEWNKRYSQKLYVYPCGTFTKKGLVTLIKDLQQQHIDVAY